MTGLRTANLALRFVLELCAFAALAYWGWTARESLPLKIALAVGAPLVAIAVWGRWVAPKASARLRDPSRLAVESAVWAAATLALVAADRPTLGLAFGVLVAASVGLMFVWGQREVA